MTQLRVLHSQEDASVNFIEEQLAGFLEARYVRRCANYFVCYLSSHSGCNRGCTFCHLTATKQTSFTPSTINDYVAQALQVFKHYRAEVRAGKPTAKYMHFSFMARGEALANPHLLDRGGELLARLGQLAKDESLPAKFCVSTIMPKTLHKSLVDVFGFLTPTIYYSLYSVDEAWRAKWMPGAMPVEEALRLLADYQRFSKKIVKIHQPFIMGENDQREHIDAMCDAIERHGLICEFNLVRYNPTTPEQGAEPGEERLRWCLDRLRGRFKGGVKAVDRVGLDVKASCGMFVDKSVSP